MKRHTKFWHLWISIDIVTVTGLVTMGQFDTLKLYAMTSSASWCLMYLYAQRKYIWNVLSSMIPSLNNPKVKIPKIGKLSLKGGTLDTNKTEESFLLVNATIGFIGLILGGIAGALMIVFAIIGGPLIYMHLTGQFTKAK